jgi:hypothetical protein
MSNSSSKIEKGKGKGKEKEMEMETELQTEGNMTMETETQVQTKGAMTVVNQAFTAIRENWHYSQYMQAHCGSTRERLETIDYLMSQQDDYRSSGETYPVFWVTNSSDLSNLKAHSKLTYPANPNGKGKSASNSSLALNMVQLSWIAFYQTLIQLKESNSDTLYFEITTLVKDPEKLNSLPFKFKVDLNTFDLNESEAILLAFINMFIEKWGASEEIILNKLNEGSLGDTWFYYQVLEPLMK